MTIEQKFVVNARLPEGWENQIAQVSKLVREQVEQRQIERLSSWHLFKLFVKSLFR